MYVKKKQKKKKKAIQISACNSGLVCVMFQSEGNSSLHICMHVT